MTGLGKTILPMISGIVEFCMRVSCALVAALWLGETVIYFAEPAAWLGATTLMMVSYYITFNRIKRKMEQKKMQIPGITENK